MSLTATHRIASAEFLGMQLPQRLAIAPADIGIHARIHSRHPALRLADGGTNRRLRHPGGLKFRNDCFPVHAPIIRKLLLKVNSILITLNNIILI